MDLLKKDKKTRGPDTTGWTVSALGLLVSTLGAGLLRKRKLGAGVLGFGLAHVILGQLDRFRPTVRGD